MYVHLVGWLEALSTQNHSTIIKLAADIKMQQTQCHSANGKLWSQYAASWVVYLHYTWKVK